MDKSDTVRPKTYGLSLPPVNRETAISCATDGCPEKLDDSRWLSRLSSNPLFSSRMRTLSRCLEVFLSSLTATSTAYIPPKLRLANGRALSSLYIVLSYSRIHASLSNGSAVCAHFAAFQPNTGLIQSYFRRKRGSLSCP
jgi:hypothetical protein